MKNFGNRTFRKAFPIRPVVVQLDGISPLQSSHPQPSDSILSHSFSFQGKSLGFKTRREAQGMRTGVPKDFG